MYFSYLDDQDIKEKIAKGKGPEDASTLEPSS